jgi:hypothetical protein
VDWPAPTQHSAHLISASNNVYGERWPVRAPRVLLAVAFPSLPFARYFDSAIWELAVWCRLGLALLDRSEQNGPNVLKRRGISLLLATNSMRKVIDH